jgi:hypothetical protein
MLDNNENNFDRITRGRVSYIYVAGMGYSGSTLLAFLLHGHPQMASISEATGPDSSVKVDEFLCSCGALFLRCPFFLDVERRVNELGSSFSLRSWQTRFQLSEYRVIDIPLVRPLRSVCLEQVRDRLVPFWPGYGAAIKVISQRVLHLAQAVLAITGKRVFVDASKDSIRVKFLQSMDQLDLKVVHLVRDIRGGVASLMTYKGTDDVAWATRAWCRVNMNAERAKRYVSPHQWLRIRYTDLCADPQGTADRIADFIGVGRAAIFRDFYRGEHHIIGNSMRLKGTAIIEEDVSWTKRLTERDLNVISRIGGGANHYFGYDFP